MVLEILIENNRESQIQTKSIVDNNSSDDDDNYISNALNDLKLTDNEYHMHDVLDIKIYHAENNQKTSYMNVEKNPIQVFNTGISLHRARKKDPNKRYKQYGSDLRNLVMVHIDDELYQKEKKQIYITRAEDDIELHQNVSKLQDPLLTTQYASSIDKTVRFQRENKRIKRISLDHQWKEFLLQSNDKVKASSTSQTSKLSLATAMLSPKTPRECVDWAIEDTEFNRDKLEANLLELEQKLTPHAVNMNNNKKYGKSATQQREEEDTVLKESFRTIATDYAGKLSLELNQLDETLYRSLIRRQMFHKNKPGITPARKKSFLTKTSTSMARDAAVIAAGGQVMSRKDSKESLHSESGRTMVSRQSRKTFIPSSGSVSGLDSSVKLIKNNELNLLQSRKYDFENSLLGVNRSRKDFDETGSASATSLGDSNPGYSKQSSIRSGNQLSMNTDLNAATSDLLQPRVQRKQNDVAEQLQKYLKDIHDPAYIKKQESLMHDPLSKMSRNDSEQVNDTTKEELNEKRSVSSNQSSRTYIKQVSSSSSIKPDNNSSTTFLTGLKESNIPIQTFSPMRPIKQVPSSLVIVTSPEPVIKKEDVALSTATPTSATHRGHLSHRLLSISKPLPIDNPTECTEIAQVDGVVRHVSSVVINNDSNSQCDDIPIHNEELQMENIAVINPSLSVVCDAYSIDHELDDTKMENPLSSNKHRHKSMQIILELLNEQETNRNKIIKAIKIAAQSHLASKEEEEETKAFNNNNISPATDTDILNSTMIEEPKTPAESPRNKPAPRSTIYFVSPKDTVSKMINVEAQEEVSSKPYNIAENKKAIRNMKLKENKTHSTPHTSSNPKSSHITTEERERLFKNNAMQDNDYMDAAKLNPRLGLSFILANRARSSIEKDMALLTDVTHKMAQKSLDNAKKLSSTIISNITHKDVLRKDTIHLFREKKFYQQDSLQQRIQQINTLDQKQTEFLDRKVLVSKPKTLQKEQIDENSSNSSIEINDSFTKVLQNKNNISSNPLKLFKNSSNLNQQNHPNTTINQQPNKSKKVFLTQTIRTSSSKSSSSSKYNKNNSIKTLTLTIENLKKLQNYLQSGGITDVDNNVGDNENDNVIRDLTLHSDLKYVHSYEFYLRKQIEQNKKTIIKEHQNRLLSAKWFIYLLMNIKSYIDNNKIKVTQKSIRKNKKNIIPSSLGTNNLNNKQISTNTTTIVDNDSKNITSAKLPMSLLKLISVIKQLIIMNIELRKDLLWDLFNQIIINKHDYQINIVYMVVQKLCDQGKISLNELYHYFKAKDIEVPMKLMYKIRKMNKRRKHKMKLNPVNYKIKSKPKDAIASKSKPRELQPSSSSISNSHISNTTKPSIPSRSLSIINNNLETVYENNSDDDDDSASVVLPPIKYIPEEEEVGEDAESDYGGSNYGSIMYTRTSDSSDEDGTVDGMSVTDHHSSTSSLWIPSSISSSTNNTTATNNTTNMKKNNRNNNNNNNNNSNNMKSTINSMKIDKKQFGNKTFEQISSDLKNFDEQAWLLS